MDYVSITLLADGRQPETFGGWSRVRRLRAWVHMAHAGGAEAVKRCANCASLAVPECRRRRKLACGDGAPGGAGPYVTGAAHPGWRAPLGTPVVRGQVPSLRTCQGSLANSQGASQTLAPPGAPSPRACEGRKKGKGRTRRPEKQRGLRGIEWVIFGAEGLANPRVTRGLWITAGRGIWHQ
jgi:hypothetical protein